MNRVQTNVYLVTTNSYLLKQARLAKKSLFVVFDSLNTIVCITCKHL